MNNMFQNTSISEEVEKSLHRKGGKDPPTLPAKKRSVRRGQNNDEPHKGKDALIADAGKSVDFLSEFIIFKV